jgi:hypothetical protein
MKLQPEETLLVGKWIFRRSGTIGDETTRRIHDLVERELIRLAADESGWITLYRDPGDGRLWERSFPEGYMHGGGPPQLRCITSAEAAEKFPGPWATSLD